MVNQNEWYVQPNIVYILIFFLNNLCGYSRFHSLADCSRAIFSGPQTSGNKYCILCQLDCQLCCGTSVSNNTGMHEVEEQKLLLCRKFSLIGRNA